jgi:histidine ammonia-lyase
MSDPVLLDTSLTTSDVARIADGADLVLSAAAVGRIRDARAIVDAFVTTGRRGYGINTGVGALSDTVIAAGEQSALSRNIVLSHAAGLGPPLPVPATRAVMAAMVGNLAHGRSGVRPAIVAALCRLLAEGVTPVVPSRGSVGYLTHAAAIALVLIGEGRAAKDSDVLPGAAAMRSAGLEPFTLEAKEGLSLVAGTVCATGLGALTVERARRLLALATFAAAVSIENLGGDLAAFEPPVLALRRSDGIAAVGHALRGHLAGSALRLVRARRRTQDGISLRAVPQVHGAALDVLSTVADTVDRELASATDNPAVAGTPEAPAVWSEAHGLGPGLALALDSLTAAVALVGAMSERRTARLLDPAASGLPAFLATRPGLRSGLQILQYTAAALVAAGQRLAAPATLGGGSTAAGQEDVLVHATPAAMNALEALDGLETIIAIELLAGLQADSFGPEGLPRGAGPARLLAVARPRIAPYADDRPIGEDIEAMRAVMAALDPAP